MQASPEQMAEMMVAMHSQCQYFKASTEHNPRDDSAYANWGSMLMHLSMVSEDQETKKNYLKEGMDKLERAIALNEDSKTMEGELAVFNLGNALYFAFFLEKDDTVAASHLANAKGKFGIAMAKEPGNPMHKQMLEQLETAHEQRKAAHVQLDRLEGKTEEEKKAEILILQKQMLESVVESHHKQLANSPQDSSILIEIAKSQFELAMLCSRKEAGPLFASSLESVEKCLAMSPSDQAAPWLKAILTQAQSYATSDKARSREMYAKSQADFDRILKGELDAVRREQLSKEREIFNTSLKNWNQWNDLQDHADAADAKAAAKEKRVAGKTVVDPGNEDMGGFMLIVASVAAVGLAAWFLTRKRG